MHLYVAKKKKNHKELKWLLHAKVPACSRDYEEGPIRLYMPAFYHFVGFGRHICDSAISHIR
jgi:hypothetical protein